MEELIHLLLKKREFINMAIDSIKALTEKKANLVVKEINDSFSQALKHITDSGLNVENIKSKFTILKANY